MSGNPVRFYCIGFGSRGSGYSELALEDPECVKMTGVAEPMEGRRETAVREHRLDSAYVHEDWRSLIECEKNADFVLIATLDHQHAEPAIAFMKKGYHVLVEKPMATTPIDCLAMVKAAEENNVMLGVCHVLRYTPYTKLIKNMIARGKIGAIKSVNLVEPVGNWHFAHSYVRGNWRNTEIAAPVIMAKSCHDIDWLRHVVGKSFDSVMCMGDLNTFTLANRPKDASDRCMTRLSNGHLKVCEQWRVCPYYAGGVYVEQASKKGVNNETKTRARFPFKTIVDKPDVYLQDIEDAVATGPYGRCVFGGCDNNQPDVVSAIYKMGEDVQVTFEMRALTENICKREVTICGTTGEIHGDMTTVQWTGYSSTGSHMKKQHAFTVPDTRLGGHWGADYYMMKAWCDAVATGDISLILAGHQEAYESHMAVFATEHARQTGQKVNIQDFIFQNM